MARDFCLGTNPVDYLEEHGVFCLDDVRIHLGRLGEADEGKGTRLTSLNKAQLEFWVENYQPEKYHGEWVEKDLLLDAALCAISKEWSMPEEGRVYSMFCGQRVVRSRYRNF